MICNVLSKKAAFYILVVAALATAFALVCRRSSHPHHVRDTSERHVDAQRLPARIELWDSVLSLDEVRRLNTTDYEFSLSLKPRTRGQAWLAQLGKTRMESSDGANLGTSSQGHSWSSYEITKHFSSTLSQSRVRVAQEVYLRRPQKRVTIEFARFRPADLPLTRKVGMVSMTVVSARNSNVNSLPPAHWDCCVGGSPYGLTNCYIVRIRCRLPRGFERDSSGWSLSDGGRKLDIIEIRSTDVGIVGVDEGPNPLLQRGPRLTAGPSVVVDDFILCKTQTSAPKTLTVRASGWLPPDDRDVMWIVFDNPRLPSAFHRGPHSP